MESKHALLSKTVLWNLVILGVSLWAPGIPESIRALLAGSALGNLGLRFKTSKPIHLRKPQ